MREPDAAGLHNGIWVSHLGVTHSDGAVTCSNVSRQHIVNQTGHAPDELRSRFFSAAYSSDKTQPSCPCSDTLMMKILRAAVCSVSDAERVWHRRQQYR
jgi:hypothetical protein